VEAGHRQRPAGLDLKAEGDLDFRGTLGVDKGAPVGFRAIRLTFEVDAFFVGGASESPGASGPRHDHVELRLLADGLEDHARGWSRPRATSTSAARSASTRAPPWASGRSG
jgi:hypothetical protein